MLSILFLIQLCAAAQDFSSAATLIGAQNGLRPFDIQAMQRDKDGYLWIITQREAQRFDGHAAQTYRFNEAITHLFIDSSNSIWVVGRQRIYLLHQHAQQFEQVFEDSAAQGFIHFYQPRTDSLFLIHRRGSFLFNTATRKFLSVIKPGTLPAFEYRQWLGQKGSFYFVRRGDTLYRVHAGNKLIQSINIPRQLYTVLLDEHVTLASAVNYRSYLLNWQNLTTKSLKDMEPFKSQHEGYIVFYAGAPYRFSKTDFVLSSNKGIFIYSLSESKFSKFTLWHNGVVFDDRTPTQTIMHDSEGNVLLGNADGIILLSAYQAGIRYRRSMFSRGEELPANDIRGFSEDDRGNIWMATTGGICRLNPADGTIFKLPVRARSEFDLYPSFRQVLHTGRRIWIGTSGSGVYVKNAITFKDEPLQFETGKEGTELSENIQSAYVWKIVPLNKDEMLMATAGGFYSINQNTLLVKRKLIRSAAWSTRSLLVDSSKRIWHGTARGMTISDSNGNHLVTFRDQFPDKRIAAFSEWKANDVFVGTHGLYRIVFSNNKFVLQRAKGFPENRFVYCITKDKTNMLWLGTDEGIYRYDPAKMQSEHFDYNDNVQPQAFNSDGAFTASNGMIYMGGHNGLNFFYPELVEHRYRPLKPALEQLFVNGILIADSLKKSTLNLAHNENNLLFRLTAPTLHQPEQIQFRYRLARNSSWVSLGNAREFRLATLAPGKYTLFVSASYPGSKWFEMQQSFNFSIHPPWWQTNWFRLALLIAILLAGYLAYRINLRKRRELNLQTAIEHFNNQKNFHQSVYHLHADILQACIRVMELEDCVVYRYNENKRVLQQITALENKTSKDGGIIEPLELKLGEGIVGTAAELNHTILVNNTSDDKRYVLDDAPRLSELAVPIMHEGRLLGVIDSEHHRKDYFNSWHVYAMESIARASAASLASLEAKEQLQLAEDALIRMQADINEIRLMNLRLQMNPHFLFNILSSVQYLVISNQANRAINYLNIFSSFLRAILEHATDNLVTLKEELRILKMYIELETLVTDETFQYEFLVEETLDQDEIMIPFMLLQPFVENAIHHGLLHRLGQKSIGIDIRKFRQEFLLATIIDNGVGLEASRDINQKKWHSKPHESRGTDIVRQRLRLLDRSDEPVSSVSIRDRIDQEGVEVQIILPILTEEE